MRKLRHREVNCLPKSTVLVRWDAGLGHPTLQQCTLTHWALCLSCPHLYQAGQGEVREAFSGHLLWTRHLTKTCMLQSQENPVKDEP